MKTVILLTLLCIATALHAAELSIAAFNTPVVACSRTQHTRYSYKWTNTTPNTLYLKQIRAFMGTDLGIQADEDLELYRNSDGENLGLLGNDHYASVTALDGNTQTVNFGANWVSLLPNDGVTLFIGCQSFQPGGVNGHITAAIRLFYTITQ